MAAKLQMDWLLVASISLCVLSFLALVIVVALTSR
jgi:hypothetical protein